MDFLVHKSIPKLHFHRDVSASILASRRLLNVSKSSRKKGHKRCCNFGDGVLSPLEALIASISLRQTSICKRSSYYIQGVSLAIGPKVFLITFKVIDVI
jgi:hypothetical protein